MKNLTTKALVQFILLISCLSLGQTQNSSQLTQLLQQNPTTNLPATNIQSTTTPQQNPNTPPGSLGSTTPLVRAEKYTEFQSICRENLKTPVRSDALTNKRLELLDQKLNKDPNSSLLLAAKLKEYLLANKMTEFELLFNKSINSLNEEDRIIFDADLQINSNKASLAQAKLEEYLKTNPESTKAQLKLAEVFKVMRDYSNSREIYTDLQKLKKHKYPRELCENYALDALLKDAETSCLIAINQFPEDFLSAIFLAIAYREKEDYKKAEEFFKVSLKRKENEFARTCLGELYRLNKNYDDSVKNFEASLLIENTPRANLGLAMTFFDQKKYEKALEYYQIACKKSIEAKQELTKSFTLLNSEKLAISTKYFDAIQSCLK